MGESLRGSVPRTLRETYQDILFNSNPLLKPFIDCMENGGDGIKLHFTRAESARVAQKAYTSKDGKTTRKAGDVYYRDCAVTGSNEGTPQEPKFPLLRWFHELIFPSVHKLVGTGGKYEGYRPIFQGDNAGPHRDVTFMKYVVDYCERFGWYWEPQGPQMPHINVLDLAVFSKMSRNHCELRGPPRAIFDLGSHCKTISKKIHTTS